MARQSTGEKPSVFARMQEFIQEVKVELAKVSWPAKEEVKSSTSVVMFLLVVIAGIVYFYDVVFQFAVVLLLSVLGR